MFWVPETPEQLENHSASDGSVSHYSSESDSIENDDDSLNFDTLDDNPQLQRDWGDFAGSDSDESGGNRRRRIRSHIRVNNGHQSNDAEEQNQESNDSGAVGNDEANHIQGQSTNDENQNQGNEDDENQPNTPSVTTNLPSNVDLIFGPMTNLAHLVSVENSEQQKETRVDQGIHSHQPSPQYYSPPMDSGIVGQGDLDQITILCSELVPLAYMCLQDSQSHFSIGSVLSHTNVSKNSRVAVRFGNAFKPCNHRGKDINYVAIHKFKHVSIGRFQKRLYDLTMGLSIVLLDPDRVPKVPYMEALDMAVICSAMNAARDNWQTLFMHIFGFQTDEEGDVMVTPFCNEDTRVMMTKIFSRMGRFNVSGNVEHDKKRFDLSIHQKFEAKIGFVFLAMFRRCLDDLALGPRDDNPTKSHLGFEYWQYNMHTMDDGKLGSEPDEIFSTLSNRAKRVTDRMQFLCQVAGCKNCIFTAPKEIQMGNKEEQHLYVKNISKKMVTEIRALFLNPETLPHDHVHPSVITRSPYYMTYDVGLELTPTVSKYSYVLDGPACANHNDNALRVTQESVLQAYMEEAEGMAHQENPQPQRANDNQGGEPGGSSLQEDRQGTQNTNPVVNNDGNVVNQEAVDEGQTEAGDSINHTNQVVHQEQNSNGGEGIEEEVAVDQEQDNDHEGSMASSVVGDPISLTNVSSPGIPLANFKPEISCFDSSREDDYYTQEHFYDENNDYRYPDYLTGQTTRQGVSDPSLRYLYMMTNGEVSGYQKIVHCKVNVAGRGSVWTGRNAFRYTIYGNLSSDELTRRAVGGISSYIPSERFSAEKKLLKKVHDRVDLLSTILVSVSSVDSFLGKGERRKLMSEFKELCSIMRKIHECIIGFYRYNDRTGVRFEYTLGSTNIFEDNFASYIPFQVDGKSIFDCILLVPTADIYHDHIRYSKSIWPALIEFSKTPADEIRTNYCPSELTALVYLCELAEKLCDTGRTYFHGICREIYRQENAGHGMIVISRLEIPLEKRIPLDVRRASYTKLNYGVDPRLIRPCRDFEIHHNSISELRRQVENYGYSMNMWLASGSKLRFQRLFIDAMNKLQMLSVALATGDRSQSEEPANQDLPESGDRSQSEEPANQDVPESGGRSQSEEQANQGVPESENDSSPTPGALDDQTHSEEPPSQASENESSPTLGALDDRDYSTAYQYPLAAQKAMVEGIFNDWLQLYQSEITHLLRLKFGSRQENRQDPSQNQIYNYLSQYSCPSTPEEMENFIESTETSKMGFWTGTDSQRIPLKREGM
jgi:hypothetical protein